MNQYPKPATLSAANRALSAALMQRDELRDILQAILKAQTHSLHVGYDDGAGGGNYVYADVVRLDDEAFDRARAALARSK